MEGYSVIRNRPQPLPMEQAVRRVREMSTLPQVALHIMEMVRDPSASAGKLTAVVENDPPLCARLLRCVNSAAYGLRYRITTVQRAVAYVGFKTVRNLAMAATIADVFKRDAQIGPYRRVGLWQHMVAVAVGARMAARRCGLPEFEEAFLAGLLHDVGIILEDQYLHMHFVYMLEHLGQRRLNDVEIEVFGFDHAVFGDRVAEGWKFPDEVIAAIRYHHQFGQYNGPHQRLLAAVVVANLICTLKGYSSIGEVRAEPCPEALQALGLDVQGLKVLAADLDAELTQHDTLFGMLNNHE